MSAPRSELVNRTTQDVAAVSSTVRFALPQILIASVTIALTVVAGFVAALLDRAHRQVKHVRDEVLAQLGEHALTEHHREPGGDQHGKIVALFALAAVAGLVPPWVVGRLIDRLISGADAAEVSLLGALMIASVVVRLTSSPVPPSSIAPTGR
jgi:ABC-type multidrug transport system fused ATPase/permease subunit